MLLLAGVATVGGAEKFTSFTNSEPQGWRVAAAGLVVAMGHKFMHIGMFLSVDSSHSCLD